MKASAFSKYYLDEWWQNEGDILSLAGVFVK
jgi:hypothetical protein